MTTPAAIRAAFPVFDALDGPFHYLDNAATGQICRDAAEALFRYETRARANVKRGVYRLADQATQAFAQARAQVADYIGAAAPEEVIFTSGATLALNTAAHVLEPRLGPGDVIVLTELEHHSNIVPWQLVAARRGAEIRVLPVDDEGRLALDRLEALLDERVRIIAATHVSNVTGAVTDTSRLRAAADRVGALVVLDGAQRAAHGPFQVRALGCDLYALSGHKLFGSTGAGALWGRGELLAELPPFLGGGEMIHRVVLPTGTTFAPPPHRFEAGTPAIGPALAMGAACAWLARQDWPAIAHHEMRLTGRLLDGLAERRGVRVIGPRGLQQRLGVVAFEVADVHAHDVCQWLDRFGVAVRGGHHCAQPLMDRFDAVATVRASLAPYNDEADIDALLHGLDDAIRRLG